MLNRITQALKAKKYHLPQVGSYTGAQLAAMLTERNAPADTIEALSIWKTKISAVLKV